MPFGGLIKDGIAVDVFEAASDLDLNYGGNGVAFVPDASGLVRPGDGWDGTKFIYTHVPQEVTAIQARLAINASGLRAAVEGAVAAADQNTKDYWQFSQMIQRDNPLIITIGTRLGLTSGQIDDLFRQASTL